MLIGLNGNKGSGKDTVGKYLVDNYGFERLSFAQKLKESAAAIFDIPASKWEELKNDENARVVLKTNIDVFDGKWAEIDISVRYFLQRYGTESHRSIFGDDFWVDALFKNFDPWDGKNYVITDARFSNELIKIKEHGGFNLRVVRNNLTKVIDGHVSEAPPPLALVDYTVYNEGSFGELYDEVDIFMVSYPMIEKNVATTNS